MNIKSVIPVLLLLVLGGCSSNLNTALEDSRPSYKPLKREVLVYLNDIATQPAKPLHFTRNGKRHAIDTTFNDMEVTYMLGKKVRDPNFLSTMMDLATVCAPQALQGGYNRVVSHFTERPNSFPVTIVYYIPGAKFPLFYEDEYFNEQDYRIDYQSK